MITGMCPPASPLNPELSVPPASSNVMKMMLFVNRGVLTNWGRNDLRVLSAYGRLV